jgi:glycosyltransferase involved in cell wall biosynthesis
MDCHGLHALVPVHLPDPDETTEDTMTSAAPEGGPDAPDLVVLSHLRWPWVWQRPQHLVSRLAAARSSGGARTWFVEEPSPGPVSAPVLRTEQRNGITRVWLEVPGGADAVQRLDFGADGTGDYAGLLRELLAQERRPRRPDVWLYTPLALDLAEALGPGRLVYDVMDDLASFATAAPGLRLRQRRALTAADVVFSGGRSLHQGVLRQRSTGVHLFPSGVETVHYERSRRLRPARRERPVAGYVGVVDERLDLVLIADVAAALPDWTVRVVGPVAKIDPSALPRAANLHYDGMVAYERLPEVMAGFDVALMPFALNDATRSISPTKTLEYLAAGLPVVSTRVPDVVADYDSVVHFADDGPAFADACRLVLRHAADARDRRLRPVQARHEWDSIAASMAKVLDGVAARGSADPKPGADSAVGAAG